MPKVKVYTPSELYKKLIKDEIDEEDLSLEATEEYVMQIWCEIAEEHEEQNKKYYSYVEYSENNKSEFSIEVYSGKNIYDVVQKIIVDQLTFKDEFNLAYSKIKETKIVWDDIINKIVENMSSQKYYTWVKPVTVHK